MNLGQKLLATWMRRKKVRAAELARRVDVGRSAVSYWLSGERRPDRVNAGHIETVTGGEVPASSWDEPAPSCRARRSGDAAHAV